MTEFSPRRNQFFYIKVSNIQLNRDNKLSQIFGDDTQTFYIGANNKSVDKIYLAKFWKDNRLVTEIKNKSILPGFKKDLILEVDSIDRSEFIKSIPDESISLFTNLPNDIDAEDYYVRLANDYVYLKNLKLKKEEVNYQEKETKFLSQYKAISAYEFPSDWYSYLPCKNCKLRPLVWEYNNGRSTACGCGENEYNHFSIRAESIMSYVSRNGGSALGFNQNDLFLKWNHWVKTGEVLFNPGNGLW